MAYFEYKTMDCLHALINGFAITWSRCVTQSAAVLIYATFYVIIIFT